MYKNFHNYEILEDGRIWSKKRKKFLKPYKKRDGYMNVSLCDNEGKKHTTTLHKAVYFAINGLWDYPEGYEINHKDENKSNNHIDNLELVTRKENCNWGTHNERCAKTRSKRVAAHNEQGELVMVFDSTKEAGINGYCQSIVSECCRNCYRYEGNNKYKGFTWRFLDEQ